MRQCALSSTSRMNATLSIVPQPLPTAATVVSVIALIATFGLAVQFAQPTPLSLALGGALLGLGIGIRLVTNATLRKNESLADEGLYALCRHPMYIGTLSAAAGAAIALNNPGAIALFAVALAIALWRIRKEERYLLDHLPGYRDYQRRVPVFPTPASLAQALSRGIPRHALSLEQLFRNGEVLRLNFYVALLAAAAFYLALPRALVAAGGLLVIVLAAASFRRHPADARRSRTDYVLPGVLGAAIVALALAA